MNVNELTSHIYGTTASNLTKANSTKIINNETASTTVNKETFAEILSSYSIEDTDVNELATELADAVNNKKTDSDNTNNHTVNDILLDVALAKEYLESQSGRQLIVSMAENSIANIISGNNSM